MNTDTTRRPPVCRECAHYRALIPSPFAPKCAHPLTRLWNPVDGDHMEYCNNLRTCYTACGPEGKLFTPREVSSLVEGSPTSWWRRLFRGWR